MDMNHACGNRVNVSSKHSSITAVMITNLNCDNIVSFDIRQGRMSSKPHQGEVFMVNRILQDGIMFKRPVHSLQCIFLEVQDPNQPWNFC